MFSNTRSANNWTKSLVTIDETFDVGIDLRTGVDDQDDQVPFKFYGKINKITINPREDKLTHNYSGVILRIRSLTISET